MMRHLGVLSCVVLFACSSGADPVNGATADGDSGAPDMPSPGSPSQQGTPGIYGDAGGGSASHDGGGATASDGGATDGGGSVPIADAAGPANAFTGAPAYTATLGPSARNAKHAGTNPAGTSCLTCHNGQKGVVAFLFGGTVWKDSAGTIPAPEVEVRVLGANGVGLSAYSDGDGNFYFPLSAQHTSIAPPAHGGMRDATSTRLMNNLLNDADCNECHKPGGEPRLNIQ